jgi:predicted RNA polymerase sigma factor
MATVTNLPWAMADWAGMVVINDCEGDQVCSMGFGKEARDLGQLICDSVNQRPEMYALLKIMEAQSGDLDTADEKRLLALLAEIESPR